jgi:hypothetical protein
VSGALAPLAAARTQRTGFILHFVSLLSHVALLSTLAQGCFYYSV